ncbi:glycosyltransferase family 32 protein [Geothrix paludis]|uniref:glycosyltransferase family 32 protein n=1 Tax=Geothrix paludis TaxID=2922722 RepID=UPI001FAE72B9|nr:glycosyltransferase [Geothrix paludis]
MPRIPKILHYCWFGKGNLPLEAIQFIDGWRRVCPDYEIREWNETNFDVSCCRYVSEAYERRKFAFVSDYARGWALLQHGGIYLDTDVELLRPMDVFLEHQAFFGFEHGHYVATSTFGCAQGHEIIKEYLAQYQDRAFVEANGREDLTTNVQVLTQLLERRGLILNGLRQDLPDGVACYPETVFSPYDYANCLDHRTPATVAIHHYAQTWVTPKGKALRRLKETVAALGGGPLIKYLRRLLRS